MPMQNDLCRLLLETASHAILVLENGRIIEANRSAARLFGGTPEQLNGKSLPELSAPVQPNSQPSTLLFQQKLEAATPAEAFEWLCCRLDNRRFLAKVGLNRLEYQGQTLVQLSIQDISEYKPAPGSLDFAGRLAELINFLPDAAFALNVQGKVIAWNQAMEQLTGLPAKSVINQGDYIYALPFYGERRPTLADFALAPAEDMAQYYPFVEQDGDSLAAEVVTPFLANRPNALLRAKVRRLRDANGQVVGVIESVQDITDRQQLQQQLQQLLARRDRQLHLSNFVAQKNAANPDLADLYRGVVARIKEQLGYYHVQLFHYDPASNMLKLEASYGSVGQALLKAGHQMPLGQGLVGLAGATSNYILSPDVTQNPYWQPTPHLPHTKGQLVVPIILGDESPAVQLLGLQTLIDHGVDGLLVSPPTRSRLAK